MPKFFYFAVRDRGSVTAGELRVRISRQIRRGHSLVSLESDLLPCTRTSEGLTTTEKVFKVVQVAENPDLAFCLPPSTN
jgi:hypothetical protein